MKITYPEDFAVAEKLIAGPTIRVGTGFDVHGFEPGDAVILCGVRIPHTKKLEGHSTPTPPGTPSPTPSSARWRSATSATTSRPPIRNGKAPRRSNSSSTP